MSALRLPAPDPIELLLPDGERLVVRFSDGSEASLKASVELVERIVRANGDEPAIEREVLRVSEALGLATEQIHVGHEAVVVIGSAVERDGT